MAHNYDALTTKTTSDTNASADINQLQTNISAVINTSGTTSPVDTLTSLRAAINSLTAVPSGQVSSFAGSSAPSGFLLCDGTGYSIAGTYATLYGVIGTAYGTTTGFQVPDLRGIFIRGAGASGELTNANSSAFTGTLATYQDDKMQGHWHPIQGSVRTYLDNAGAQAGASFSVPTDSGDDHNVRARDAMADASNGTPRVGAETNPANLSLNYIIKT